MSLLRRAEAVPLSLTRPAAAAAGLLLLALAWHLSLPGFFYRSPGVFIDGPLPSVAGVAAALWRWRDAPPVLQVLAGCAGALVALLASVLVFGTLLSGPWHSLPALWGELRSGFRLPFSALVDTWASPYFRYALWSGLRPILLWGTVVFAVLLLREPRAGGTWRGLGRGVGDRWAFNRAQRRQMKAYRAVYLAAVRGGEAPPPAPPGLMSAGGQAAGLSTVYLMLKIGLAVAGALGLVGGAWSLLGDVLRGPLGAIFARGLTAGG